MFTLREHDEPIERENSVGGQGTTIRAPRCRSNHLPQRLPRLIFAAPQGITSKIACVQPTQIIEHQRNKTLAIIGRNGPTRSQRQHHVRGGRLDGPANLIAHRPSCAGKRHIQYRPVAQLQRWLWLETNAMKTTVAADRQIKHLNSRYKMSERQATLRELNHCPGGQQSREMTGQIQNVDVGGLHGGAGDAWKLFKRHEGMPTCQSCRMRRQTTPPSDQIIDAEIMTMNR